MSPDDVAAAQAATLFGLALTDQQSAYIAQLESLGEPLIVVNALIRMLSRTLPPEEFETFGRALLATVHQSVSSRNE